MGLRLQDGPAQLTQDTVSLTSLPLSVVQMRRWQTHQNRKRRALVIGQSWYPDCVSEVHPETKVTTFKLRALPGCVPVSLTACQPVQVQPRCDTH